jgi:hypothetical protein
MPMIAKAPTSIQILTLPPLTMNTTVSCTEQNGCPEDTA